MPIYAQDGLNIKSAFDNKYKTNANATFIYMKGQEIKKYGLTVFKSLTLPGDGSDARNIETLVKKDAKYATSKEVNLKGGMIHLGLYSFKPLKPNINRYIFYRNNATGNEKNKQMTLIYMEGKASIDQLRKTFGNK